MANSKGKETEKYKLKSEQLGMSLGTANARLIKLLLFHLVKKCDLDVCYRCGDVIDSELGGLV